ncbi:MAG TPA: DUF819 domain-containing protein [Hellea balneolensis]|uniref:DUF819 domain-containing protein n=1 Tax=Hellea balneolensis TaxID=287478 RepID=A0A7C5LXW6_9PROT|nr:DUF819 domain-containing protein [Hellea balneolensis]
MITTGFSYLAVLFALSGLIGYLDTQGKYKVFKRIPGIVILYFLVMLLSTFGLWEKTESITASYKAVKGNLLPSMIFLLLLKGDVRQIAALGPKMILAFLTASISISIGFVLTFLILKSWLPQNAWMTFAALSGSWMGGTGNMVAVQGALNIPDASMGYTLLMDSIDYAVWVMLLLAFVPHAPKFNRWTKSNTKLIDEIGAKIEAGAQNPNGKIDTGSLILLIGIGLLASALAQYMAGFLPTSAFFSKTTWTVLIVTIMGALGAMTRLGGVPGSSALGNVLLYGIVALIASRANFAELGQAPTFIVAGFMILIIHGLIMVIVAKLFKLDLFSCGVASLANVGGVASAPILAAAYSRALIPIGVLMAMLGYIIGTGGGLLIGKILSSLV